MIKRNRILLLFIFVPLLLTYLLKANPIAQKEIDTEQDLESRFPQRLERITGKGHILLEVDLTAEPEDCTKIKLVGVQKLTPIKYTVKTGDNMWRIAKDKLVSEGTINPSNKQIANQIVKVSKWNHTDPKTDTYCVKEGNELKNCQDGLFPDIILPNDVFIVGYTKIFEDIPDKPESAPIDSTKQDTIHKVQETIDTLTTFITRTDSAIKFEELAQADISATTISVAVIDSVKYFEDKISDYNSTLDSIKAEYIKLVKENPKYEKARDKMLNIIRVHYNESTLWNSDKNKKKFIEYKIKLDSIRKDTPIEQTLNEYARLRTEKKELEKQLEQYKAKHTTTIVSPDSTKQD